MEKPEKIRADVAGRKKSGGISSRVLKAVSVFGGVQMTTILCGIVKVKLIALWLGPVGVGLFGIFNGAVDMISSVSQLGVRSSAVKDIAAARQSPAEGVTVTVVRRWGWLLGIFGALLMLAAAPLLSHKTFGDSDHTTSFMLLAAAMLLGAVSMSEQVVMQGLDRLGNLARSTVWSAIVGLAVTAPMYYFWHLDSIIPSILTYYVVILITVGVYRIRGVNAGRGIGAGETLRRGIGFIKLGFCMTVADALSQLMSYVFIAWLNNAGGGGEVGYYQAGFTIVNRYTGLLLTAVAVEYFPRLASVASSQRKLNAFVANEALLLTIITLPCVLFFISFAHVIISLLYSDEFSVAVPFVTVAMVGVVMRCMSYCMSYVILAKGDGRTFIITESVSSVAGLALNVAGYMMFGIDGLGVSYTLWYLLYLLMVSEVYFRRYRLRLPRRLLLLGGAALILTAASAAIGITAGPLWVLPPAIIVSALCLRAGMKLARR